MGFGVVIEHEGAAAEARALRLHQAQHRLHRYRRIHRAATGPQHREARLGCQRIGGNDDGVAGKGAGWRFRGGSGRGGRGQQRGEQRGDQGGLADQGLQALVP